MDEPKKVFPHRMPVNFQAGSLQPRVNQNHVNGLIKKGYRFKYQAWSERIKPNGKDLVHNNLFVYLRIISNDILFNLQGIDKQKLSEEVRHNRGGQVNPLLDALFAIQTIDDFF